MHTLKSRHRPAMIELEPIDVDEKWGIGGVTFSRTQKQRKKILVKFTNVSIRFVKSSEVAILHAELTCRV